MFVATNIILLQQTHVCHDKTSFVMTKVCFHDKTFGMERRVVFDGGKPAVTVMLPSLDHFSCM